MADTAWEDELRKVLRERVRPSAHLSELCAALWLSAAHRHLARSAKTNYTSLAQFVRQRCDDLFELSGDGEDATATARGRCVEEAPGGAGRLLTTSTSTTTTTVGSVAVPPSSTPKSAAPAPAPDTQSCWEDELSATVRSHLERRGGSARWSDLSGAVLSGEQGRFSRLVRQRSSGFREFLRRHCSSFVVVDWVDGGDGTTCRLWEKWEEELKQLVRARLDKRGGSTCYSDLSGAVLCVEKGRYARLVREKASGFRSFLKNFCRDIVVVESETGDCTCRLIRQRASNSSKHKAGASKKVAASTTPISTDVVQGARDHARISGKIVRRRLNGLVVDGDDRKQYWFMPTSKHFVGDEAALVAGARVDFRPGVVPAGPTKYATALATNVRLLPAAASRSLPSPATPERLHSHNDAQPSSSCLPRLPVNGPASQPSTPAGAPPELPHAAAHASTFASVARLPPPTTTRQLTNDSGTIDVQLLDLIVSAHLQEKLAGNSMTLASVSRMIDEMDNGNTGELIRQRFGALRSYLLTRLAPFAALDLPHAAEDECVVSLVEDRLASRVPDAVDHVQRSALRVPLAQSNADAPHVESLLNNADTAAHHAASAVASAVATNAPDTTTGVVDTTSVATVAADVAATGATTTGGATTGGATTGTSAVVAAAATTDATTDANTAAANSTTTATTGVVTGTDPRPSSDPSPPADAERRAPQSTTECSQHAVGAVGAVDWQQSLSSVVREQLRSNDGEMAWTALAVAVFSGATGSKLFDALRQSSYKSLPVFVQKACGEFVVFDDRGGVRLIGDGGVVEASGEPTPACRCDKVAVDASKVERSAILPATLEAATTTANVAKPLSSPATSAAPAPAASTTDNVDDDVLHQPNIDDQTSERKLQVAAIDEIVVPLLQTKLAGGPSLFSDVAQSIVDVDGGRVHKAIRRLFVSTSSYLLAHLDDVVAVEDAIDAGEPYKVSLRGPAPADAEARLVKVKWKAKDDLQRIDAIVLPLLQVRLSGCSVSLVEAATMIASLNAGATGKHIVHCFGSIRSYVLDHLAAVRHLLAVDGVHEGDKKCTVTLADNNHGVCGAHAWEEPLINFITRTLLCKKYPSGCAPLIDIQSSIAWREKREMIRLINSAYKSLRRFLQERASHLVVVDDGTKKNSATVRLIDPAPPDFATKTTGAGTPTAAVSDAERTRAPVDASEQTNQPSPVVVGAPTAAVSDAERAPVDASEQTNQPSPVVVSLAKSPAAHTHMRQLSRWIDRFEATRAKCDAVEYVAVDAEGVPERLLLLQVATRLAGTLVVDLVSPDERSVNAGHNVTRHPLLQRLFDAVFFNSRVVVLMHDCRCDVLAFAQLCGVRLDGASARGRGFRLLDTQLALELWCLSLVAGFSASTAECDARIDVNNSCGCDAPQGDNVVSSYQFAFEREREMRSRQREQRLHGGMPVYLAAFDGDEHPNKHAFSARMDKDRQLFVRRPLPEDVLAYAVADVECLLSTAPTLHARIERARLTSAGEGADVLDLLCEATRQRIVQALHGYGTLRPFRIVSGNALSGVCYARVSTELYCELNRRRVQLSRARDITVVDDDDDDDDDVVVVVDGHHRAAPLDDAWLIDHVPPPTDDVERSAVAAAAAATATVTAGAGAGAKLGGDERWKNELNALLALLPEQHRVLVGDTIRQSHGETRVCDIQLNVGCSPRPVYASRRFDRRVWSSLPPMTLANLDDFVERLHQHNCHVEHTDGVATADDGGGIGKRDDSDHDIDETSTSVSDGRSTLHQRVFGPDNRASVAGALHRISRKLDQRGQLIGLTLRIGRAMPGVSRTIDDLLFSPANVYRSILFVAPPNSGKTTWIRDVARRLADQRSENVVIVDTSNEIAGDAARPHPAIGEATRLMVPFPRGDGKNPLRARQGAEAVIREAVENHTPSTIVIDELCTAQEANSARVCAERGVRLIASCHGSSFNEVRANPDLGSLFGAVKQSFKAGGQAMMQRVSKAVFPIVVMLHPNSSGGGGGTAGGADGVELSIVHDTEAAVDAALRGQSFLIEHRVTTPAVDANGSNSDHSKRRIGGEMVIKLDREV